METLVRGFQKAGLTVELTDTPMATGINAENIFGMDIQQKAKGNRKKEHFRIYKGAHDNVVQVLNADKNLNQAILLVHEKKRWFEETVSEVLAERNLKAGILREEDILRRRDNRITVKRHTSDLKRHFLVGLDERHLFITQCSQPVTTVREAHNSLKSSDVRDVEGKKRNKKQGRTFRQGEWFFLHITEIEQEEIDQAVKRGLVKRKENIGRFAGRAGGNPHIVEELLNLRDGVYVRGNVRHSDHKTLKLRTWRKVVGNTETNEGRMEGVNWID